jgi:hypothetical protein
VLRLQARHLGAGSLGALHDLDLDVLELRLPAAEGLELVLEGLQVLGGAGAGVEARAVARRALTDELHVGLGLGDLALDVAERGAGADELGVEGCGALLELGEAGPLRQVPGGVGDLVESRVDRLEIEQPPLA